LQLSRPRNVYLLALDLGVSQIQDERGTLHFDHIGLVVESLSSGRQHLSLAFHIAEWTAEFADSANGVFVQFGRDPSGVCYELIAPLGESSPIAQTLRRGDRILNHVAYLVEDIEAEVHRLSQLSFDPIGHPKPAIAYDHKRIQFFRSPLRFIVELIECPRHEHAFAPLQPHDTACAIRRMSSKVLANKNREAEK